MDYHTQDADKYSSVRRWKSLVLSAMQGWKDMVAAWRHSRLYRLYAVLLLLAWIKQLIWPVWLIDSREFAQAALHILNGRWSSCGNLLSCGEHWLEATRRTPGYPLIMTLTLHPAFTTLLQLIPALHVPVLVQRLSGGSMRVIALLFLLYPLQFFYTAWPMPEIWVQWLLLWAVWSWKERKWQQIPFLLSALLLLKPVFMILLPLCLYLIWRERRMWHLLPMGVFLLVSLLNQRQTGWFHYSSMGVENAWEYNRRAVMNQVNSAEEIALLGRRHDSLLRQMNYRERSVFMQQQTREKILAHPVLYGWLHFKGSLAVLFDPGRYDLFAFLHIDSGKGFMGIKSGGASYWQQPLPVLVYLLFFLLLRLAVISLALRGILTHFRKRETWVLFGLIALFCAVAGPVGSARYLFPVAPMLFVLAVQGLPQRARRA